MWKNKMNMNIIEFVEEHEICKGKRIKLMQKVYRYNNGITLKDVIGFGQSVAVVPFKDQKTVIMIKQFRPAINQWIIEIPAGKVEAGEDPMFAAIRELREEIGYVPKHLEKLISIYPSPGYSDEIIHIYLAKDLTYVGASPEVGELIEVIEVDFNKAIDILLSSDIVDAKTLIALLLTLEKSLRIID